MKEKTYSTRSGVIHYWTHIVDDNSITIVFLQDNAGSCVRYNKAWHKNTSIPLEWIKGAGHNSNTDKPDIINRLIENFIKKI